MDFLTGLFDGSYGKGYIIITLVLLAIWAVFWLLERILLKKKGVSVSSDIPVRSEETVKDYVTEIYETRTTEETAGGDTV